MKIQTLDELFKELHRGELLDTFSARQVEPELFRTVCADPPWNESGGGKVKRGADRHYPLLKTKDIVDVMLGADVWGRIADAAHMYMWVTNNFLEDGLWVLKQLGFRYVTNRVWAKDRFGLGQYWRGQHELLLFAVRGKGYDNLIARGKLPTLIGGDVLPRGDRHSEKPQIAYDEIREVSRGPHLEMFARDPRPGWTVWGNEVADDLDDDLAAWMLKRHAALVAMVDGATTPGEKKAAENALAVFIERRGRSWKKLIEGSA